MSLEGFVKKVEAIGDVLVGIVHQKGTRPDALEKALDYLVDIVEYLNRVYAGDANDFVQKVMPPNMVELGERNPGELGFRMWLAPELMLKGYSAPLDTLGRVHQAALESGNTQAAAKTADALTRVVRELASEEGNEILLRIALARVSRQAYAAARLGDPSLYNLVHKWYISTVFEAV